MPLQFALLGVPVTVRPTALLAGVLSSSVIAGVTREHRFALSAAAGMLWYTADGIHVIGHIISSQAVDAPMDAVDFGLYPKSVYVDHDILPQQHIGRASGGVIASLLAAVVLIGLSRTVTNLPARRLMQIAAAQHGLLFFLSMLPIRVVDGGILYSNMLKLLRSDQPGE